MKTNEEKKMKYEKFKTEIKIKEWQTREKKQVQETKYIHKLKKKKIN